MMCVCACANSVIHPWHEETMREAAAYTNLRSISVVMTRHEALGFIVTSPVIRPTSPNSSDSSRNFWLLSAYHSATY